MLLQFTTTVLMLEIEDVLVNSVAPEKTSNFMGTVEPPLTVLVTPFMSIGL